METEKNKKSNNSRLIRTNLLDEDAAALSAFRRRNRILILVLLFLLVLLAFVVAVLIIYFLRTFHIFHRQPYRKHMQVLHGVTDDPGVKVFCREASDRQSCLRTLARKFTPKSSASPSQIFTYSLQTAAAKLESFVSFLSNVPDGDKSPLDFINTCSNSSVEALTQVTNTLAAMRTVPSVEALSPDKRREMMSWMDAAAENLGSCLGELKKVKAKPRVATEEAAVGEVKEYVDNGSNFLRTNGVVLQVVESYVVENNRSMDIETLFGITMVGLQLLYMFCLFWWLFRIR